MWRLHLFYRMALAEAWLKYITAATRFTNDANMKTGNHRPWDWVTNSAVSGPTMMPGIVASVLEMAKVVPALFGATSAWLLRCPAELNEQRAIQIVIKTIADGNELTDENIIRKIAGPARPTTVINLRTARMDQLRSFVSESAQWPAAIPVTELTMYGRAVKLIDSLFALSVDTRYVGSHCITM